MLFKLQNKFFENSDFFTEETAPDWLTSVNTVKGSTMDNRWFFNDYVLTLEIGKSIETDFNIITRIK